jgi:hypothetical protein
VASSAAAQLTEAALAQVRAKPGFRQACEAAAAKSVALTAGLDHGFQWIIKDIGRAAICVTAAVLHYADELTMQNLTAATLAHRVSSPGRVSQLVRRCQAIGQFAVDDGPGIWTRRRAQLGPAVLSMLRGRGLCDMAAALTLAPELGAALAIFETEEGAASALVHLAMVCGERRDLFDFTAKRPLNFFMEREAGMSILFDLLVSQPPDRQRLLQEATLSRYALSRRYGVSRAHINKLLADSGHTEAIGDRVIFSETLSEALEAHYALVFAHNHGCARALLSGWRFQPGRRSAAASAA